MATEGVSAPYDVGTHFALRQRFGAFLVAPLLRALGADLESGSLLRIITLIDPYVRTFLKAHGHAVWRFPWRHDADLRVGQGSTALAELIVVAEANHVKRLAVWLHVLDVSGNLLLEAEDGNDYLWLVDGMPQGTKTHLVESVGGAASQIDHVAATW